MLLADSTLPLSVTSPVLVLTVALGALPPPVPHPLLCSGHLGSSPHAVYSIRPWMSPTSAPVSYLCLGLSSSAEAGPSLLLTLTVPACCSATPSLLVLTTPLLTAFLAAFHLSLQKALGPFLPFHLTHCPQKPRLT